MNLITPTEMHVDDVDSGVPLLTLDASGMGGPGPTTYALSPDAVRRLVDALVGVAPPTPGEARITIKVDTSDLRALLLDACARSPAAAADLDHVADERASLRRIREMLAPVLGLGVDEEAAEVMVDRATRIPRLAVLLGCPAETIARGWTVQRPQPRGDGTWFPGALLAGHECKEWGTSLDVPDGTVGDSDRGLDVALSLLEAS